MTRRGGGYCPGPRNLPQQASEGKMNASRSVSFVVSLLALASAAVAQSGLWVVTDTFPPLVHPSFVSPDNSTNDPDDTIETSWLKFGPNSIEGYVYGWDEDFGNRAQPAAEGVTARGFTVTWNGTGVPVVDASWAIAGSGHLDLKNPPAEGWVAAHGFAACSLSSEVVEVSGSKSLSTLQSAVNVGSLSWNFSWSGLTFSGSIPLVLANSAAVRSGLDWSPSALAHAQVDMLSASEVQFYWRGDVILGGVADGDNMGLVWDIGEMDANARLEVVFSVNGEALDLSLMDDVTTVTDTTGNEDDEDGGV